MLWEQIANTFESLLELSGDDRDLELGALEHSDPDLFKSVTALLKAHNEAELFLSPPGESTASQVFADNLPTLSAGSPIGRYRIIRTIARGGMGTVYEAARADDEYNQRVAIKVAHLFLTSEASRIRFQQERQALATLTHPNITRILDGGSTDDGTPYLVMELVDGVPLIEYCRTHHLSIRASLNLFTTVCEAVHHAHQKLIIHRDIKPNNILVDSNHAVKLVDFGIASIQLPSTMTVGNASAILNQPHTPGYASPEQIRDEPPTTATDLYSLGMVLLDILDTVDAEKVTQSTTDANQSLVDRIDESSHPDELKAILHKCTNRESSNRYSSVILLAGDVEHYCEHRPVVAFSNRSAYRLRKFLYRHRRPTAAILAGLILSCGAVGYWIQQARTEHKLAIQQRSSIGESIELLERIVATSDPYRTGATASIGSILTDADVFLSSGDEQLKPEVEAGVRLALGRIHLRLLNLAQAIPYLQRSLDIYEAERDSDDLVIAECLTLLAMARAESSWDLGKDPTGVVAMQERALNIRRDQLGDQHPEVARTLMYAGCCMWAESRNRPDFSLIEVPFLEAMDICQTQGLTDTPLYAELLSHYGNALAGQLRVPEAEAAFAESLALYEQLPAHESRFELQALLNHARHLKYLGRLDESQAQRARFDHIAPTGQKFIELEKHYRKDVNYYASNGDRAAVGIALRNLLEFSCSRIGADNDAIAVPEMSSLRSMILDGEWETIQPQLLNMIDTLQELNLLHTSTGFTTLHTAALLAANHQDYVTGITLLQTLQASEMKHSPDPEAVHAHWQLKIDQWNRMSEANNDNDHKSDH